MEKESLTEEAFLGWKADPVTRLHYQLLRAWVEALKAQWAEGMFRVEGNEKALGQVELLNRLLELDLEQLVEGTSNE